jgi:josephin
MASPSATMYHERQSLQLCGVHCINAMLQRCVYTQAAMDAIAESMDPSSSMFHINAHRSMFGLGNYDANVILKALGDHGFDYQYFDARQPLASLQAVLDDTGVIGILVNHPTYFLGVATGRHWLTIRRQISDEAMTWFNLDSKLPAPDRIGSSSNLLQIIQKHLATGATVILVRKCTDTVSESVPESIPAHSSLA